MPRDGTATRQRILDAAEKLLVEHGYAATSVEEVIAASDSSKGAFFHHFGSKLDLARVLVDRYVAGDLGHLEGALAATAEIADPARRAVAFVRVFEEQGDALMEVQSGCLYTTVLAERGLSDDAAGAAVRRAVTIWRERFGDVLRDALRERATPRGPVDADDLADHLFVSFEGAFLLCRTEADPRHMRAQLRVYRQLLAALLGVEDDT